MVQYTRQELAEISFLSLTHHEGLEENRRLFGQLLAGQISSYSVEKRIRRKDGSWIWVRASATVLRDEAGKFAEVIGLIEDISDRKHLEGQRDALIGALERSNEDYQRFAYAPSHDLRSPLRTIKAMVQLLEQEHVGQSDTSAVEIMGFVTTAADRMDTLIADLLAFSQVDQPDENCEAVDLQACLDEALTNLQISIAETRAVVTSMELPVVNARRGPMVLLFQNVVGNALKYRQADPPRVQVSIMSLEADWHIMVEDNGIGFDAGYAQEIFAPFKRLHGNEYPGSGIGLASCKRIVERYGGRIWAHSTPGVGSVFTISLPNGMTPAWNVDEGGARVAEG